jgi:F-type H+-transporting ATPase subunit epsilon
MSLALIIRTPAELVVDAEARSLTAEDRSGRFGVRPRVEPLVSVLVPSLLAYVDAEGREVLVAVGEGVLHAEADRVDVAVRSAVVCSSLASVRREVISAAAERREGAAAMHDAFKSLYRNLIEALADEERLR